MSKAPEKRRKASICYNCDATLLNKENYCPQCGQENHSKQASVKLLFNDFLGDYLAFDSRLFRSIVPLVKQPGRITVEYLDGKRQRFIPPIRVFLFLSFLYFGISLLTGQDSAAFEFSAGASGEAGKAVGKAFENNFNVLLFLYTPIFALLIRPFFKSEKRNFYVNFFVYGLHLFSFFFIVGMIQILFFKLFDTIFDKETSDIASVIVKVTVLSYTLYFSIVSLKVVFEKKYTILRFVAVFIISLIAFLVLLVLAIFVLMYLNQ